LINEIQISPINERFIELYNSDDSDVDLTDWYIQRKTATGSSFGSLVTSTQLNGKTIKAHDYFLISRSQLEKSDIVAGSLVLTESNTIRIRDSKGKDSDQVEWGSIADGESYQRTASDEWVVDAPTPGVANAGASVESQSDQGGAPKSEATSIIAVTSNTSSFPVEPQIFAKITAQTKTVSVGAATTFAGRVWGLKKEPIENARMVWAFGDGASAEGTSVSHTYYYPGEYTAILDASSGYYAASDRVRIVAVVPTLALTTGGDEAHSFITLENRGSNELDLSGWQIMAQEKTFTIPKSTFIGARKTLTFASEVTGLATPQGSSASLRFPNGTAATLQGEVKAMSANKEPIVEAGEVLQAHSPRVPAPAQTASVLAALDDVSEPLTPASQESYLWMWYTGVAFLAALALFGLRYVRSVVTPDTVTADDFEIIDESEKDDLF
jgi:hypothetical protein